MEKYRIVKHTFKNDLGEEQFKYTVQKHCSFLKIIDYWEDIRIQNLRSNKIKYAGDMFHELKEMRKRIVPVFLFEQYAQDFMEDMIKHDKYNLPYYPLVDNKLGIVFWFTNKVETHYNMFGKPFEETSSKCIGSHYGDCISDYQKRMHEFGENNLHKINTEIIN